MAVHESIKSKGSQMPSESAAIAIASISNWAYARVTGTGLLPSRKNNLQRIQFGYSPDNRSSGPKDIVELRRDSRRRFLSFCAIRAVLPKTDTSRDTQAEDYLTARMEILQRTQRTKTREILFDSWISPVAPQVDLHEIDFDELEASPSEETLDHVVLGQSADVLSEQASRRVVFIVSSIIEATANKMSSEQQHASSSA